MPSVFRQRRLELFEQVLGDPCVSAQRTKPADHVTLAGDVSLTVRHVAADHVQLLSPAHASS